MHTVSKPFAGAIALAALAGLSTVAQAQPPGPGRGQPPPAQPPANLPFKVTEVADLEAPWAMTFLPDARMLVTEKNGQLKLVGKDGAVGLISGVPQVVFRGQASFGDVVLHPKYADNQLVYLSYSEPGEGDTSGVAVARAKLVLDSSGGGKLENLAVIWQASPKVASSAHYSQRIAFSPDGAYMFVSAGERAQAAPAQDMQGTLGKIMRLNDDGSAASGNPFAAQGGVTAQIWSLGHRNPLGLAFDAQGRLWNVEMGPQGGDELNLVQRGANYGWPTVSNGQNYNNSDIPDHPTRPEFSAPAAFWVPSISPSSLIFYSGTEFPEWQGDAFIGALSGQALVRVEIDGTTAKEAARYPMGRIRGVDQGPDGALYVLEDAGGRGGAGRILKLTKN